MKRILVTLSTLGFATALSQATVTYQMSSTSSFATNFLSGSGSNTALMVWGIIVDSSGDGFQGANALTPYDSGFAYSAAASAGGIVLNYLSTPSTSVASDDILYISGNLMNLTTNTNDSQPGGINRITNLSSISYTQPGVGVGDNFQIVWFDVTALGGNSADGTEYGMYQMPSLNTLQADPGTYNLSAAWSGADAPKAMSFTLGQAVPEPSAMLLGAFGILGLLRRRRA